MVSFALRFFSDNYQHENRSHIIWWILSLGLISIMAFSMLAQTKFTEIYHTRAQVIKLEPTANKLYVRFKITPEWVSRIAENSKLYVIDINQKKPLVSHIEGFETSTIEGQVNLFATAPLAIDHTFKIAQIVEVKVTTRSVSFYEIFLMTFGLGKE